MSAREIDKPALNVDRHQLHANLVAHIHALAPRTTRPSTGIVRTRAQVPFSDVPVTRASNCSPIRDSRSIAAADLLT